MEPTTIDTAQVGQSVQNFHMSLWDLFLGADWLVQSIMLMLVAASIWSWAIIFSKTARLKMINRQANQFEEQFWSGSALDQLYDTVAKRPLHPMAAVFVAGMKEWQRKSGRRGVSLQERIERILNVTTNREMEDLESQMIFLASVGSTAPFVGLFGTVWGIMDSFQGIAASQSTNLAVVAPGIAEALFATAVGLIAAIPAVLAYNKLSTEINRFGARLEGFSDEFLTLISRQVEEAA
jgi:biopolymer transport protein TolQ